LEKYLHLRKGGKDNTGEMKRMASSLW